MRVVANITTDTFPKQGDCIGCKVKVCFHYETDYCVDGIIVRCDHEKPYRTIIHLNDGRYVLGTECQYSMQ